MFSRPRSPYISLTSVSGQALIYAMLRELFTLEPAYHSVSESIFLEDLPLRSAFPFFLQTRHLEVAPLVGDPAKIPFPFLSSLKKSFSPSTLNSTSSNPRIIFPCVKSREARRDRGADSAAGGWIISEEGILIFAARWKKIKSWRARGGSRFC